MTLNWHITSKVSDIFAPKDNKIIQFIAMVDRIMNSNTVLLKGIIDKPITTSLDIKSFFTEFRSKQFIDLFLEFDRLSEWFNYHEWHPTPDTLVDYNAGFVPSNKQINNLQKMTQLKPMSYLNFVERLDWMLRTSYIYYPAKVNRPNEKEAQSIIRDVSLTLFGADAWALGDLHPQNMTPPKWINHPWIFYDIVPNFLYSTADWEDNHNPNETGYFDSRGSDSCTLFFKDTTFYVLLTNGSP